MSSNGREPARFGAGTAGSWLSSVRAVDGVSPTVGVVSRRNALTGRPLVLLANVETPLGLQGRQPKPFRETCKCIMPEFTEQQGLAYCSAAIVTVECKG
jgi:hypothetical protein